MSCFAIRPCKEMGRRETDEGLVMECMVCLGMKNSRPTFRVEDTRFLIAHSVRRNRNKDLQVLDDIPWTAEEMTELLVKKHAVPGDKYAWKDGYCEESVSIEDAKYDTVHGTTTLPRIRSHPLRLSLQKPHSYWRRENGTMTLHDLNNITLTKWALNMVKANFPPAILPQLKRAVVLWLKSEEKNLPVCRGYYSEGANEWKVLE